MTPGSSSQNHTPMHPAQSEETHKHAFYRTCMEALNESPVPYVVGGAYAVRHYTGIARRTKDLDIFVRPDHCDAALAVLARIGYRTEVVNAGWLAKCYSNDGAFIDVIFRSGNGVAEVDDDWFARAESMDLFGVDVPVSPPEEVIWSKAFTMERERFDLADVAHMIQAQGHSLDWRVLLDRFDQHWRILMAHLILYGFIYPGRRDHVPAFVMEELTRRLQQEGTKPEGPLNVCMGTLLSGSQYLVDVIFRGYEDARFTKIKNMSTDQLLAWRHCIEDEIDQRLNDAGISPPEKAAPEKVAMMADPEDQGCELPVRDFSIPERDGEEDAPLQAQAGR